MDEKSSLHPRRPAVTAGTDSWLGTQERSSQQPTRAATSFTHPVQLWATQSSEADADESDDETRATISQEDSVAATADVYGEAYLADLTGVSGAQLQRKSSGMAGDSEDIQTAAAQGVRGGGGTLPFLDEIQASFGAHDLSEVRAHVGGEATEAAGAIGAEAYATGNDVAFARAPSLHTAAHEAAHVVQQRGGVQLLGGVGEEGDVYERHADTVADRVVAGDSAEGLLDRYASAGVGHVQRKAVQRSKLETSLTTGTKVSDGRYGWMSSYDIEMYDDHCMITIGVQINPDAGVTARQVGRVKTVTNREFQRHFDNVFVLRDAAAATRPLRMQLDFNHASPHVAIALHAGAGRDNLSNWFVNSAAIDRAHELGHQLGLRDEYVDATVPNRANATSPGVHADHSLMGQYYKEGIPKAGC